MEHVHEIDFLCTRRTHCSVTSICLITREQGNGERVSVCVSDIQIEKYPKSKKKI